MDSVTISLRVPKAEAEALQQLAVDVGLDRATLLKQALRRGCSAVRLEQACDTYRRGEATLSRAADIAGITLRDFLLRLPQETLELSYSVRDLHQDLEE